MNFEKRINELKYFHPANNSFTNNEPGRKALTNF